MMDEPKGKCVQGMHSQHHIQAQALLDKLTVARTDNEVEAILLSIPHG
jgi:hypothetical protein